MLRRLLFMLVLGCLAWAGCSGKQGEVGPRPIDPAVDICPSCKMSIVDMHYAAQLIDGRGQTVSFDDVGCMALYVKKLGSGGEQGLKALYVKDFNTLEWVPAGEASYVQGRVDTPMSSGIVAFAGKEEAQELAGRIAGKLLIWEEVLAAKRTVGFGSRQQDPGDNCSEGAGEK